MENKNLKEVVIDFFTNRRINKQIAKRLSENFNDDESVCNALIQMFCLESFKECAPIFFEWSKFLDNEEEFKKYGIIKNDIDGLDLNRYERVFLFLDEGKSKEPIMLKCDDNCSCEVNAYVGNNVYARFEGGKGTIICTGNANVRVEGEYSVFADDISFVIGFGNCKIVASGLSTVIAHNNCHVIASGDSMVIGNHNCFIEGKEWSRIRALHECRLSVSEHCSCIVTSSAIVEARGNSVVHCYNCDGENIKKDGDDVIVLKFS